MLTRSIKRSNSTASFPRHRDFGQKFLMNIIINVVIVPNNYSRQHYEENEIADENLGLEVNRAFDDFGQNEV